MPAFAHVHRGGFDQAVIVHAAVLEESPIFDRQHRVHQDRWYFLKLDELALGAILSLEKRSHKLRLQLVSLQILIAVSSFGNGGDLAATEADHGTIGTMKRLRSGNNPNAIVH